MNTYRLLEELAFERYAACIIDASNNQVERPCGDELAKMMASIKVLSMATKKPPRTPWNPQSFLRKTTSESS